MGGSGERGGGIRVVGEEGAAAILGLEGEWEAAIDQQPGEILSMAVRCKVQLEVHKVVWEEQRVQLVVKCIQTAGEIGGGAGGGKAEGLRVQRSLLD